MDSIRKVVSSSSDRDSKFDEKKWKRMESNRESARRSRERKKQRVEELTSEITQLQNQNGIYGEKIESGERNYRNIDAENNVLRAQIAELTERLNSLNSLTQFCNNPIPGDPIGVSSVDIPEIPDTLLDTLLEPWQTSYPEPWQLPFATTAYDELQF